MTERFFTNSEIETRKRCKRKHYLGYIRRLEPSRDRLVSPRMRGNMVHLGLALWYETGSDPLELIKAEHARVTLEYLHSTDEPDQEDLAEIDKVFDLVLAMLEGYVEWVAETGIDLDLELVGSEVEISYHLGEREPDLEGVNLLGKLDERFRRRSDGLTLFWDHKTVGDLVQLPKWAQINPQLLTYNVLLRLSSDEVVDGGVFNMLRTVKRTARANPPFYARHEVRHNRIQLNNHYAHTLSIIREIIADTQAYLENGGDHHALFPPTPNQDCAWSCPFFALCPMMDDGSDWEGLIGEAYREHDPLERYVSVEKG